MAPQIQKTLQNKPGSDKMWYKLLKSGEKQRAYRMFRNTFMHRGRLAFAPRNSEIISDTEHLFHPATEYYILKTSSMNGNFNLFFHPDYSFLVVKSDRPEYDNHSEFITGMFEDEYPELYNTLMIVLRDEYQKLLPNIFTNTDEDQIDPSDLERFTDSLYNDRKKNTIRNIGIYLNKFIVTTMREVLTPSVGVSARYRKEITKDLLDALPSHRKVIALVGEDNNVRSILRYYQDGFRKKLSNYYTKEHIINLFVNFKEKLFEATNTPLQHAPYEQQREALYRYKHLEKSDIEEIIYSAIEENPQDIELFVNNIP